MTTHNSPASSAPVAPPQEAQPLPAQTPEPTSFVLKRIWSSFAWTLTERGVRAVGGVLVGILVARHLGPTDFGILGSALAFQAIFAVLATAGADDLVVRDISRETSPERKFTRLQAAWHLRIIAAAASTLGVIACAWLWKPGHIQLGITATIISISLLFSPFDIIACWFQAHQNMRTASLVRLSSFLASTTLRLLFLIADAPLAIFAASYAIDAAITAFALSRIHPSRTPIYASSRLRRDIIEYLGSGFPQLLSSLLVILTLQLDRLALFRIIGESPTGIYVAGSRITESAFVIPQVLGMALLPQISTNLSLSAAKSRTAIRRITLVWIAFGIVYSTLASTVLSPLIPLLLGPTYAQSASVFIIHSWSLVFVGLVSLRSKILVALSLQAWVPLLSALTLLVSLPLNLLLISQVGVVGAAWAFVLTWLFAALLLPLLFAPTRSAMRHLFGMTDHPLR